MGSKGLDVPQLTVLQEETFRLQQPCALPAAALSKSGTKSANINVIEGGELTHGSGRVKIVTMQKLDYDNQ